MALVVPLVTACAPVGPDYLVPEFTVAERWRGADDASAVRDSADLERWWHQFNDPLLVTLVRDALADGIDLRTAVARLREVRARRDLERAGLGPSLDLSVSASHSRGSAESGGGTSRELYSAGLDAGWEIDLFGAVRRGVEAAEAEREASAFDLGDAQVVLVAEVARNFIELRTAQRRLALSEDGLAARIGTYDLTRWRHQAGLVSALDVAQARTQVEQARAGLHALHTAIAEARHRLAVLLGRAPGELDARLAAAGGIPEAGDRVAVGIPADTLRRRPDVRAAERRLAAQTARLGAAEAARYPGFRLSGTLGLEALSPGRLFGRNAGTGSLLAALGAPLFDAGRIRSEIEVQDALLEQSRLAYRAALLAALEEVENALVGLADSRRRRDDLAVATGAARDAWGLARQQYAAGLVDFQSVLDTQRTLLGLEDELATANGARGTALIRLYKAVGGGWEAGEDPAVSGGKQ